MRLAVVAPTDNSATTLGIALGVSLGVAAGVALALGVVWWRSHLNKQRAVAMKMKAANEGL